MAYINVDRINDDIIVWERNNPDRRDVIHHKAVYEGYIEDSNGEYTSIHGKKLRKLEFTDDKEYYNTMRMYINMGIIPYETDILVELKLLSKLYYGKPAPKLNLSFYDIENDYDKNIGYARVENPYAPINSIAVYNNWEDTMYCISVPAKTYDGTLKEDELLNKMTEIAEFSDNYKVKMIVCEDEVELLTHFIDIIDNSDGIVGWNSIFFDTPYTAQRLLKVDKRLFNRLSFHEARNPKLIEVYSEMHGRSYTKLIMYGRLDIDYMELYKKYEANSNNSSLNAAAAKELVDSKTKKPILEKIEYDGVLADLYQDDYIRFLRYNIRDVEILVELEKKLGYVELANQMYHMSTAQYHHVTGTIALSDLATINYCHYELDGLIVHNVVEREKRRKAKGAFVLIPRVGEHKWIGSIDINSLYPSVIRSLNLSPETILGQFEECEDAFIKIRERSTDNITLVTIDNKRTVLPANEFRKALLDARCSVSGFGTVFRQDKKGIMVSILESWYAERKKYQKLKAEAESVGDMEKANYYDKIQFVYKIKLNSYYGSLLNAHFRFYDERLGESTTATSRHILLHQCAMVSKTLDGEYALPDVERDDRKKSAKSKSKTDEWFLKDMNMDEFGEEIEETPLSIGYSDKWSMIYSDTDSSYFDTKAKTQEEATKISDELGEIVNASFPDFMEDTFLCTGEYKTIIKTARENIASRGIFIDKKRYILRIVDSDGIKCDKMKIMGVELKKSTMSKEISAKLSTFVEQYLKGKSWEELEIDIVEFKEYLHNTKDIMEIGLPISVKKLDAYMEPYTENYNTRLPGNVAASIFYNTCLDVYEDTESPRITSGDKIKVFYLDREYGRFKTIAFPADIERIPTWFEKNFKINKDAQIHKLVDAPLMNIIKAINKQVPSRQSILTNELLTY